MNGRAAGLALFAATLAAATVSAADLSVYRGLKLGMTLNAAAQVPGTRQTEMRLIHRQPALIQEMDWQPLNSNFSTADRGHTDPVREAVLSFVNGELFRIVVMYDRYKVEGMTPADFVEALSATYGPAVKTTARIAFHTHYAEATAVLARWEDADYSYNLVNGEDRSTFALILLSKRLDAQAQTAIAQAVRLEVQNAPQVELDKKKQRDEDARTLLEKARTANKLNFRP